MTQFDPKTHRFGMAYKFFDLIAYPFYLSRYRALVRCFIDDRVVNINRKVLTRCPGHDLIPKSQADKLADVLAGMIEDAEKQMLNPSHHMGYYFIQAKDILEEYEGK